jgi:CubicO group peptidase (beta-lactamase class C family)
MIPSALIEAAMARLGVPGVAVGFVHGRREEVAGFGVTSVTQPLPVDGDTLFQIGSISKTFTGMAIMRLVEAGEIDLDSPVRTYVPELELSDESVAAAVTPRQLLSHTGGWVGDYFDSISRGDDALARMILRLKTLDQQTPLGTTFAYNNSGFYILGRAIETVTQRPFEAAMRELILDPLGLPRCFYFAEDVMTERFAVGHDRDGKVAHPWATGRPLAAAGGVITSVRELLNYARAQWTPSEVLSAQSLQEMRTAQVETGGGWADAVALPWFVDERGGTQVINHAGAVRGQHALLVIAPEQRFALAVLTNHDSGPAIYREVASEVVVSQLDLAPAANEELTLTDSELDEYAGIYDGVLQQVELRRSGQGLTLHARPHGGFPEPDVPAPPAPPPADITFTATDTFTMTKTPFPPERSNFVRGGDGTIEFLRYGGRLLRPATQ